MTRETRTIDREAEIRAKAANVPPELIRHHVADQIASKPIEIRYDSHPHGSVDLAEIVTFPETNSVRITFNTRHKFVMNAMLHPSTTPIQRAAMEICLATVLGAFRDLDGTMDKEATAFYQQLLQTLSERLQVASGILFDFDPRSGENMVGDVEGADVNYEDPEDDPDA